MKRLKIAAIVLMFSAFSALAWAGVARAQTITSNVDAHKTVDGSVYSAGKRVRIAGTVNGDVYCAGQDVTISGTVKGDVICVAQNITVTGKVEGSVRVAAQNVSLRNSVGHSVSIAAQQVTLEKGSLVKSDATLAGSNVDIDGKIGRDATLAGASTTITGTIMRNVRAAVGNVEVTRSAKIGGSFEYTSNDTATIANKSSIAGNVTHHMPQHKKEHRNVLGTAGSYLVVLSLLVVFALVLVLIFPQEIHKTSMIAANSLGKTVLVGVLAGLVVPIVLFALAISIVGVPLAILACLVWLIILMLSGPIAAYYLGSMILSKNKNPIVLMLVGSLIVATLYFVPLVGGLFMFVALLIGVGAIVLRLKQVFPTPVYKVE